MLSWTPRCLNAHTEQAREGAPSPPHKGLALHVVPKGMPQVAGQQLLDQAQAILLQAGPNHENHMRGPAIVQDCHLKREGC